MKIIQTQDIFLLPQGPDEAIGITTNGCIKKDGTAVMGRGMALYADQRFGLSETLGRYLAEYGNQAFYLGVRQDRRTGRSMSVVSFPTKHDWRDYSDLNLIVQSCHQAMSICDKFGIRKFYLTKPGCANGRLDWESMVRPVIEPILDDRFVIADRA